MDTILILLGVLGFGAIIIAVHVFLVGSEAYGYRLGEDADDSSAGIGFRERSSQDRRSGLLVVFPLLINDTLLEKDRRSLADRRRAARR